MKFIVIGCGRVGSGLAQTLDRRGHTVVVIDIDPHTFERLEAGFRGRTIHGVGFDRAVLTEAGIKQADGLAAVTGSDEVNVVTARLAGQFYKVPKVIARLFDPRKADIYRRLGLQTVTPLAWEVNRIVELLSYFPLANEASIGNGQVDLVDTEVPQLLIGRSVNDLTVPGEIHVVAITRGGQTFLPTRGALLQRGDWLHLALLAASGDRLKALLGLA
ncbi:MAG: NAD-binding protein [Anaerolineae bacterium]|nr:NAD-binding protein [Anaerolineae bacterium]